ncbi:hypothetical protein GBAR_LOCUS19333 [Geodia barretti]|uniref:Uncharacterized protein n=1 Tax=Geodia barretti TaxID=519541 RepID=A0AA35WUI4_GEOBA|nr:hypothetical protein GBAR_LOCUS19333 [Geodia barretti]
MVGKRGAPTKRLAPKKPPPPIFPDTNYPKPPPTPPGSPPPYRMPRCAFDCACGRITPFVVRIAVSETRRNPQLLPYNSPAVSHVVMLRLKAESDEMVARVGSFMNRLIASLKSRSVSSASFAKCLLDIQAYNPTRGIPAPLLEHRSKEIKSLTSIDDLILTVSDYISFFNSGVLEHLVSELGTDEDREELETFLFYSRVFSKRSVFQVPSYAYGYLRLRTESLVVMRVDDRLAPKTGASIQELSNFMGKVCDVLQLLPHTLHFCEADLDPGGRFGAGRSLEIAFRVPPHVVHEVFPLSTEEEKDIKPNDPDAFSRTLTGRKSGNQKLEESLSSRLKLCCGYHWQMERQRSQSCTLVTGVDAGYDGDSDSSSDERAPLEPIPVVALRPSYQKRLMWRLANSHF